MDMSYLTWREYARSWLICLGVLLVIAGSILAIMVNMGPSFMMNQTLIGGVVAIIGLVFIILGFFYTKKKRDSVTAPVDTRVEDTPPPPPPPD